MAEKNYRGAGEGETVPWVLGAELILPNSALISGLCQGQEE